MAAPTSVAWRQLTLGAGTPYRVSDIEGWEELPPARYDKVSRARAHGSHPSPVWSDERVVTLKGWCWSSTDRDALLLALQQSMTFDGGEEPLAVTAAGRTLTAGGQLLAARQMLIRGEWGVGRFGWLAQWRCTDPLRYGPQLSASTGLPSASGGLAYPLAYPLDYGAAGNTGKITLVNDGTADAPILFRVRGDLPQGFELSATGQRLRYPVAVPGAQLVELNTDAGSVLVEGTADRRANLTVADWMRVPARGSLTVQFTSLGGPYDPAAQLTALWKPANW